MKDFVACIPLCRAAWLVDLDLAGARLPAFSEGASPAGICDVDEFKSRSLLVWDKALSRDDRLKEDGALIPSTEDSASALLNDFVDVCLDASWLLSLVLVFSKVGKHANSLIWNLLFVPSAC